VPIGSDRPYPVWWGPIALILIAMHRRTYVPGRAIFLISIILSLVGSLTFASVAGAAAAPETVLAELQADRIFIEDGAVAGDESAIREAIAVGAANGIDAYVVVLADDASGITAASLVNELGQVESIGDATVLLFGPTVYDFNSEDFCQARMDLARPRADGPVTTGDVDQAVTALMNEIVAVPAGTCEASASSAGTGSALNWILVGLALLALAIFAWVLYQSFASNRRRAIDESDFEERRQILKDWAITLRQPITDLQAPVAAAKSSSLAAMFNDALKVARESEGDLNQAMSLPDLDRAEIRIARAHMQIRDVRKSLDR